MLQFSMNKKITTKIHRGIKYRLYPTDKQQVLINETFGHSRFVCNKMLRLSKDAYDRGERFVSRNQFNYRLTALKKEFLWLRDVDSTALESANNALATAFSNFFAKRAKLPTFHKKQLNESYTSRKIQGTNNIALGSKYVKLPKLGYVKAKTHRLPGPNWLIKSATVSRDSDGKFYVSILFEFDEPVNAYVADTHNAIGLDYASDGLYVDNNGNVGTNHKYYRESHAKLAKAQRKLSRMRGSKKHEPKSSNYLKQLRKMNKIHRHIANQRKDNLHKLSTEIANRYDVVCVEDLNMKAMSNKGFGNGKATMDNGYGMFLPMLEYKLNERGKYFIKVDKWYPSSQICHACGTLHPEMKDLKNRTMRCDCGLVIGRDQNAAINILNEGLRILAAQ